MSKVGAAVRAAVRSPIRSKGSEPSTTDYAAIAIDYAEQALADRRGLWSCRWLRLAARRFIDDLNRTRLHRPPFYFSSKRANAHCAFIERLPHVEGTWDLPTLLLQPAQVFFVVQLFGFRNVDGGRRFTEALLCIARKNAKSTLAAAILLSCMCLERENGAQVLSAATTGPQARILWNLAKRMVDRTPDLSDAFDIETFANSIQRPATGAVFKPINSKASTQDGLNPSHTGLDEIHAHKTHDLLNVLRSAAGARKSPLWLYTTTEGYETPGPWPELRTYARQVLEKLYKADHFLALIFALDDDDDLEAEFDPQYWVKANPLLPTNPILLAELQKLATNARAMPGSHAEFRIKRLNRPAASAVSWVNLTKWRACSGDFLIDDMVGHPCWAAFDGASTSDMAAWRLLWLKDGIFYTAGRYWVPADAVAQRTERRSVPYAGWVRAGYIEQTPGDVIDHTIIERVMEEDFARFQPRAMAFDPWNTVELTTRLAGKGMPVQFFIQGPKSYHPAMTACEIAYLSGKLRHAGHPVLTWNAANVVPRRDVNLNMAPDRKRSADKIDGMCALFMCFGLAAVDNDEAFQHALDNVVSV